MPLRITGSLASPLAGGTTQPLVQGTLYVVPSSNAGLRIQYGGTGAYIPVVANSQLPAGFQYGFSTQTDGSGTYDFKLPLPAETRSSEPALKWNIVLPDGTVYTGAVPAVAGPLTLEDLLQTYSWVQSQGLIITAPLQGTLARGTRTVTAQTTVQVFFAGGNMPSAVYQVLVRASADSVTGAVPEFDVPENLKTVSGFTITFSPGYTGTFDFLAMGG